MIRKELLAASVCMAAFGSSAAFAQVSVPAAPAAPASSNQDGLGDIVVTAQKTSSTLQRTPLAITALSNDELNRRGLTEVNQLAHVVPSLVFSMVGGQAELSLRGIGLDVPHLSGEGAVALNIDGVYVARQFFGPAAIADLERVEVLRGPQGTLYGRNATGGAVNLITHGADRTFTYEGGLTVGSFGDVIANGAVGGPLSDTTRGRFVLYADRRGDDAYNTVLKHGVGNKSGLSTRGTLAHDFSPNLTSTIRADYSRSRDTTPLFSLTAATPVVSPLSGQFGVTPYAPGGIFQSALNLPPSVPVPQDGNHYAQDHPSLLRLTFGGVSLTNEWSPGDSPFSVKTITAFRISRSDRYSDADGSSASIQTENSVFEHAHQFTQEVNLGYKLPHNGNIVVGAFYFNEGINYDYEYTVASTAQVLAAAQGLSPGSVPDSLGFSGHQSTESYAFFGQADVPITSRLKLTAGIRYTSDRKTLDQTLSAFGADECRNLETSGSWNSVTYKGGINYQLNNHVLFYASVSSGFKGGGINIGSCGNTFKPEKITAYEAGIKSRLFNNTVQANIAAFRYNYDDIQANITIPTGSAIQNAAAAIVQGAEAELSIHPTPRIRLSGSASYVDSRYKNFALIDPTLNADPVTLQQPVIDVSGNPLIKAPRWSGNITAAYTLPLGPQTSITASYDGYLTTGYNFDVFSDPNQHQRGYTTHNLRLSWTRQASSGDTLEIGLFVHNLTDERYFTSNFANTIVGGTVVAYSERRTFGVSLKFKH